MNRKAFTLIELLVVVLIIGILSAIALPQYTTAVEKSRAAEALINLKHIQEAYIIKYMEDSDHINDTPQDFIELSGGKWDSNGRDYCTKHFYYEFAHPDIYAHRENYIADDCSTSSGNSYFINIQVPPYEGWEDFKVCTASDDTGYRICKSLEGQGLTTSDERE